MADGRQSNLTGLSGENYILSICQARGFTGRARYTLEPHQGKAPHGTGTTVSTWLEPCELFPQGIGIDMSSQTDSGSAYQKVPYKIINIGGWNVPGLIIVEGQGRGLPEMRRWAAVWHLNFPNCLGVFTVAEFTQWLDVTKANASPITSKNSTKSELQGDIFK